jgi:hypothetical protein
MANQKADLLDILKQNEKLFDCSLGAFPHRKVHIDINPDAKHKHTQLYPVLHIHLSTLKRELDLNQLGIFVPQQESEWVCPSFIIPK